MNIWVTSDTHFDHANIIKYCNRPFKDVDEMNNAIWQNWNSVVDVDDVVYHLGDFALGPSDGYIRRVNDLLGVLNGKIYLIKGNHDRKVNQLNFEDVYNGLEFEGYLLSHVPKETDLINIHGHVHNNMPFHYMVNKYNVSVDVTGFKPVNINTFKRGGVI